MIDQEAYGAQHSRRKLLITGSSGWIGTELARAVEVEYEVVGLDRYPPSDDTVEVDWHRVDLTDVEDLRRTLDEVRAKHGTRLDAVVHLAAYYDFSGEPSPLYEKLTIEGTRSLLRALQSFDVGRFVFSSSMLVHAPSDDGRPITEDDPLAAEWDYPESKIRAEQVVREERGKHAAVILRIAGVYDEDCHAPTISQQIARIDKKEMESYFFPGDPEKGQSFVHIRDAVDAIRRAIHPDADLGPEEVFLIGEPDVVSYAELQEIIGTQLHGEEWPSIRIPKSVAKAGAWMKDRMAGDDGEFIKPWMIDFADAHYPVSIDRAREKLGWEPGRRLRDVVPEMVSRLRENRTRWYALNGVKPPESVPGPKD